MGHTIRILATMLLIVGAAALAWSGASLLGPRTLQAEFVRSSQDDPASMAPGPARQAAEFRSGTNAPDLETLRIELVQVMPYLDSSSRDRLSVSIGGDESVYEWVPGAEIFVDDDVYRMDGVRTWQGLLPMTDGAPMVSVSLLQPDEPPIENILLRAGQRLAVGEDVSIELRECAGRDDALAQIAAAALDTHPGRWGIVDGTGVIWFESFTPGTGATLSDGSLITLETFSSETPSLVVRKRSTSGTETLRVDAPSNSPPLFLELGSAESSTIDLYVYDDGRMLVSASPPADLADGHTWPFPEGPFTLRLEQALRSAAPISAVESPFFEGVLESGAKRIRVRQGEAVRAGDSLLRYLREPGNATATFVLRIFVSGDDAADLELHPGERYIFAWAGEAWSLAHAGMDFGGHVTIERQGRGEPAALFGLAAMFLAVFLFWKSRSRIAD